MKIRSLEIRNFRQFYGEQEIGFSVDDEKNITLIHAENGVGKTALLNAILWCFYETFTDNFERKKDLLNHMAKKEGDEAYRVTVTFEEKGKVYSVKRSRSPSLGSTFKIHEVTNGNNYVPLDNPGLLINSIIPKEMSRYFFFQGEGIGTITNEANNKQLKNAIRDILGFTLAEKAIEDIGEIVKELRKESSRIDKTSERSSKQKELISLEGSLENTGERLSAAKDNIAVLVSEIEAIEEFLKNSNSEVVKQLHKRRKELELELQNLRSRQKGVKRKRIELVRRYAIPVYAKRVADSVFDFINEQELKGRVPEPYNEQLVKDIISESRCICGTDILPGTDAYKNIHALLGKAANQEVIDRINRARSRLTVIRNDIGRARNDFDELLKESSAVESGIEDKNRSLKELSSQMVETSVEDIKEKEKRRKKLMSMLDSEKRKVWALETAIKNIKEEIKNISESIERIGIHDVRLKKLDKQIAFSKKCYSFINAYLEKTEIDSRQLLLTKINEILKKFVRQDYKATLDDLYSIKLVDPEGNIVGKSDGQKLLLSLTFISSLISLAILRNNASGEILTPGAIAPFVIDAPFGVLDNKYKGDVAKSIPAMSSQLVFLLSSSHWEGSVEKEIRDKVGKEYNLVLEVSSKAGGKEVDHIDVLGHSYETVRYGRARDMTKIEEIGEYV